jgi:ABC-type dipeptide/oligopeptide/nickel transport system ATPase component
MASAATATGYTPPDGPVLKVEDLRVMFIDHNGVNVAVQGASLHVNAGEVLGIVGESGSGKTVTCASAMGLLHGSPGVVQGKVWFDPGDGKGPRNLLDGIDGTIRQSIAGVPLKDRRAWRFFVKKRFHPWWGLGMTMIFQNPQTALHPFWRVGQIVGEAVKQRDRSLDKAGVRKTGLEWLERVKLNNVDRVWTSHAHELSGGMAQRVMIAASLARGARLLFADEPTTGLDTTVKARIVELFSELRKTESLAMVVISHDLGVVASLADRVVVMKGGEILETQPIANVTSRDPSLHEYTRRLIGAVDVWSSEEEASA